MPPGFMNAISGILPAVTAVGSLFWASAIRLPSGDSPLSSGVRLTEVLPAARCPMTLFSIGATSFLNFAIRLVIVARFATSRVTMRLPAVSEGRMTSPVFRSIDSLMFVTRRPRLEPLVTRRRLSFGSLSLQL